MLADLIYIYFEKTIKTTEVNCNCESLWNIDIYANDVQPTAWHLSSDMQTLDTVRCTVGSC